MLQFVRRYLVAYLHWYLVGVVAVIATNWMSVTIPLYLADGIDALTVGGDVFQRVYQDAVAVALMGFLIILVRTVSRVAFFTPGRLVEARIKADVFERLLLQQKEFTSQWQTGDLISRITSDINYLRLFAGFAALQVVNVSAAVGLAGFQMIRISPSLAFWVCGPVILALGVTRLFLGKLFQLMRRLQSGNASLSAHVLASYQAIGTVQDYGAEPALEQEFQAFNQEVLTTTLLRAQLRTVIGPVLSLGASINVCILLGIGGPMAIRGEISVGELVAFTTLVAYLIGPLRSLSFLLSMLKQAEASLERINALVEPPIDRPEGDSGHLFGPISPSIEVRNLTFTYPRSSGEPVLQDVSFSISGGGTLGIVGLTGAGKSTLLDCLARVYNPAPGTVFVDGTDVLDLDLDGWRERLSYVPQRAFLFSESLTDNILLGRDDDLTLARVVERTALTPDVERLPNGLDTQVGEAGLMLSGGQRQRTALARGLAREHRVLMLDDVLSAVDHETEDNLIRSIRDYGEKPTTIIVAHRISALQHADHVVVLGEGRVLDQGTPEELSKRPGLYRDLCERQGSSA